MRLVLTQALKRSPIDIRDLALVPRTQNAKALGLFLASLLKLARSGVPGTDSAIARARATSTWRGLPGQKLRPRKSAPAPTAARASSAVQTPQIFTFTDTRATPRGRRQDPDAP